MKPAERTIAVVDYTCAGHVPMTHKGIVAALLENGERVYSLCGWQQLVRRSVEAQASEALERLETPAFAQLEVTLPAQQAFRYLRWLPARNKLWPIIRANVLLRAYRSYRRWQTTGRLVHACARRHPESRFTVMISCLDEFVNPLLTARAVDRLLPYAWSGIHLGISKHRLAGRQMAQGLFRWERIFQAGHCVGIASLDEGVNPGMREWLPGKKVVDFPDFTDDSLPTRTPDLVQEVRRRAAGRPIIGLLGMLQPRKGIHTLLEVAKLTEAKDWFFLLAGSLAPMEFPAETVRHFQAMQDGRIPNAFAHLHRIKDEAEFNALFASCQVVFAAYENFVFNSGILTKASAFKVPVVVSKGYLLEERVWRWRMGVAVPQRDVPATAQAIRALLAAQDRDGAPLRPNFDGDALQHGRQALRQALRNLLG